MELTVKERLVLMNMLPKEANFTTLKIMRKFNEALSFNEAEHKALNFRTEGDKLSWDFTMIVTKDVEVGDFATELIRAHLKKLDKDNKLTEDHFSLFEKFVEGE
jgi:hypothetical protein